VIAGIGPAAVLYDYSIGRAPELTRRPPPSMTTVSPDGPVSRGRPTIFSRYSGTWTPVSCAGMNRGIEDRI